MTAPHGSPQQTFTQSLNGATEARPYIDRYLAAGWPVLPLNAMQNGRCTCGRPDCTSPGKHPIATLAPRGFLDSSTNSATVAGWLGRAPWMNVGVPTGRVSGITVVDVDADHGGMDSMGTLEARHGHLPTTRMAFTGGGGVHLLFTAPDEPLRNSASRIGKGIDVRGDGGYICVAPSGHASGGTYAWDDWDVPILPMPNWLLAHARARPAPTVTRRAGPTDQSDETFGEGGRNDGLTKIAGSLRRHGCDEITILAALETANRRQCSPPLDDREVQRIAASVSRYEPAVTPIQLPSGFRPVRRAS